MAGTNLYAKRSKWPHPIFVFQNLVKLSWTTYFTKFLKTSIMNLICHDLTNFQNTLTLNSWYKFTCKKAKMPPSSIQYCIHCSGYAKYPHQNSRKRQIDGIHIPWISIVGPSCKNNKTYKLINGFILYTNNLAQWSGGMKYFTISRGFRLLARGTKIKTT